MLVEVLAVGSSSSLPAVGSSFLVQRRRVPRTRRPLHHARSAESLGSFWTSATAGDSDQADCGLSPMAYVMRIGGRGPTTGWSPPPPSPRGSDPRGVSVPRSGWRYPLHHLAAPLPPLTGPLSCRQGSAHYRLGRPLGRPSGQCSLSRAVLSYFTPSGRE